MVSELPAATRPLRRVPDSDRRSAGEAEPEEPGLRRRHRSADDRLPAGREGRFGFEALRRRHEVAQRPPAGVNTADYACEPSISGDWLLFARQTSSTQFVILRSLTTSAKVVLDQGRRLHHAGQVNGDFAVWTSCTKTTCNVVRREITPGTNIVLPKPSTKYQYGAAVTSTGIVYAARGGASREGPSSRTSGRTDATSGAHTRGTMRTEASTSYYDRYLYAKATSDICRVHDPHPGP